MEGNVLWMLELSVCRAFTTPFIEEGTIATKRSNAIHLRNENDISSVMYRHTIGEAELSVSRALSAPFPDKGPIEPKDLNSMVSSVDDIDEVLGGVDCYSDGENELTITLTSRAPFVKKGTIDIKDLNSIITAVGDKDTITSGVFLKA